MSTVRLKVAEALIKDGAIVITRLDVVAGETGESLRVAKITPELLELFHHVEIDVTDYMKVQELIKANPAFFKLVNTFNLTL